MLPPPIPASLTQRLQRADHVVALTGAGISAESGIPTFRDAQTGLWAQYDPQELATPDAFRRNPQVVWQWYEWRRSLVREASPNAAHYALVQMEQKVPRLTIVTQNVDGLHAQAGSGELLELHGNIMRNRCFEEGVIIGAGEEESVEEDTVPRCPRCGERLRPDVVWFGEPLPEQALAAAVAAIRASDLLLCIGTSALVHPAASLPFLAIEQRITTVEINPEQTPLSEWVDYTLRGTAGAALPAMVEQAWPELAQE